jgi:ABC-type Fe3+-hydroxamate transport system substrate-binding protein
MKRITLTFMAVILLLLSACAEKSSEAKRISSEQSATLVAQLISQQLTAAAPTAVPVVTPTQASEVVELKTDYTDAVSVEQQLLTGSFKLEGTNRAITKDQAAELVSLWNNLENLVPSSGPQGQGGTVPSDQMADTETQEKIKSLVKQILTAMKPEQVKAIADMKITEEIVQKIMEEQNISTSGDKGGQSGSGTPPDGGQPPSGGGPGGSGTPPSGGGQMSDNQGGAQTGGMLSTELIKALVEMLQKKTS